MATVPKLQWKFMTEGNPFGRRIMTNVAEVVAWMAANFDGDKEKIPSLKYITGGSTLCERQIVNLSEVVQAMFDNWGDSMYTEVDTENNLPEDGVSYFVKDENEKYVPGGVKEDGTWDTEATKIYEVAEGVIAPTYAYATETTKPLAVLYIENMPKVVGEMYKQMFPENWTEEDEFYFTDGAPAVTPPAPDEGAGDDTDDDDTELEDEYEEVDKSVVTTPDPEVTYYVKNENDEYVEGGVDNGEWLDVTVYVKKVTTPPADDNGDQGEEDEETPSYTYTIVDKSVVTEPEEGVQYYVEDGNGGYVEGGVDNEGAWLDVDVFTRDEAVVEP